MTYYRLKGIMMADAEALAGKIAGITGWDDDELEIKVTYPTAKITGIIGRIGPYLHTGTGGAEMTDATAGAHQAPDDRQTRAGTSPRYAGH